MVVMKKRISLKKTRLLFFSFLLSIAAVIALVVLSLVNPVFSPAPLTLSLPIDTQLLKTHVKILTEIDPPRSAKYPESLNAIADYIRDSFHAYGIEAEFQTFTADGAEYKNVVARYGQTAQKKLIIGAHYDVDGEMPGADDNASAVAGLLELARLLGSLRPQLDYDIELVAYTLEELPYFGTQKMGSAVHADSLPRDAEVLGMISLEMIGYFSDEQGSQRYPFPFLRLFYPSEGNFIAVVGKPGQWGIVRQVKRNMGAAMTLPVYSINAPTLIPGIDYSDHQNYWKKGYPAIMVTDTAFQRNPNYHKATDTADTLNYEKMAEVVKGVYAAAISF